MKKKKILIWSLLIVILAAYLIGTLYFNRKFMSNTKIGDYDVSGLSIEEAAEKIKEDKIGQYSLMLHLIDGKDLIIFGKSIDLDLALDLEPVLKGQNAFSWTVRNWEEKTSDLEYTVLFDEEKLKERIRSFPDFDERSMIHPEDAYVSDYEPGVGYEIISETKGNWVDKDELLEIIKKKITNLETRIDLSECGLYEEAKVKQDNPELIKEVKKKNAAIQSVITYDFETEEIVLDADTYHTWITYTDDGFDIDEDMAAKYVEDLISKTDTAYTTRPFHTTSGRDITVTGPYGYRMAPNDERTQLLDDIKNGRQVKRKPVYTREGNSRDGNDYGDTYVEVDLGEQKVYLYVDGNLIGSSDCVSGNESNGNGTPGGIYPMTYKQKDAVLRGPGYASPVSFWMPFNGGIGLHDASWRSTFGGKIYKTNGSHGCINLPYSMAKTIYENAYTGMPVICFY